ncbi:MAG: hypothetical protein WCK43_06745 [bacterium]
MKKLNIISIFFKALLITSSLPIEARVEVPASFNFKETKKVFEVELETNSLCYQNDSLSPSQCSPIKIPLSTWNAFFNPTLKPIENINQLHIVQNEEAFLKFLSQQDSSEKTLATSQTPLPQGTSASMAEAPFREFQRYTKNHQYHNLVEDLKNWLAQVQTLREFKLTPELANYWDSRIHEQFLNSNGILKTIPESLQFQININSQKGLQTAIWINHLLIVQKKLDAASVHQATKKEIHKEADPDSDTIEVISKNFSLAAQRESYLKESDKITALILDWSHNYKNKLTNEEIDSIVSTHISFGEKLESYPQDVELQINDFLLEQTNKKPSKAIILSEEQRDLWHSLQNTLRLGARISTANATKELIKNIKNYTQKNTCRNFDKVNEGLGIAVDLLDHSQRSFQENNALFGQTFLNQAHKVLATFAPLALQITTDSIQFSKED